MGFVAGCGGAPRGPADCTPHAARCRAHSAVKTDRRASNCLRSPPVIELVPACSVSPIVRGAAWPGRRGSKGAGVGGERRCRNHQRPDEDPACLWCRRPVLVFSCDHRAGRFPRATAPGWRLSPSRGCAARPAHTPAPYPLRCPVCGAAGAGRRARPRSAARASAVESGIYVLEVPPGRCGRRAARRRSARCARGRRPWPAGRRPAASARCRRRRRGPARRGWRRRGPRRRTSRSSCSAARVRGARRPRRAAAPRRRKGARTRGRRGGPRPAAGPVGLRTWPTKRRRRASIAPRNRCNGRKSKRGLASGPPCAP